MAYGTSEPFDLPILEEDAIVDCIKTFINVPITVAQLRQPSPEILQHIFGAFVCSMLEISNEQITQLPLHVIERIELQDLQLEDGAGTIIFINAITYLMDKCGIEDFTLNDILKPLKKRTRKLLSAIVNYAQFTITYEIPQQKNNILSKIEIIKEEQKQYIKRNEELPPKISNLKSKRLERQKSIQELNLNEMKSRLQELETLKKKQTAENAKAKGNVEELVNLRTVVHASKLIQQGKEAVDVCKERVNVTVKKEELIKQHEEVAPSALRLVQDAERESVKCKTLLNDMEKVEDHFLELSQKDRAISAEIQNVDMLITTKQDKRERTKVKCSELIKLVQEREEKLSNKVKVVQKDMNMKEMRSREATGETLQIKELMLLYDKEHKEVLRVVSEKFTSLHSKAMQYSDKIIDAYQ